MQIRVVVPHNFRSNMKLNKKTHTYRSKYDRESGVIALTSLLVISVVVLSVVVSSSLLGILSAQNSLVYKKGAEALHIAHGCVEEALLRLRNDTNYSGGSLQLSDGSCTITVTGSGNNRTIFISSQLSNPPRSTRELEVTVKRTGTSISILTWQEE